METSSTSSGVVARRAGRSSLYTVRPTADGFWRIEASHGFVQGLFRSRRDAVRFAVFEIGGHGNAVVLDTTEDASGA